MFEHLNMVASSDSVFIMSLTAHPILLFTNLGYRNVSYL